MAVAITRPGGDITGVAASGNVASYSSVNIGTAATDRIVVVCVGTELASSTPTACTIDSGGGAVSMTAAEAATQGAVNSHIFYLAVATGTTATVAVTFGATNPTADQNHIAVYRVVGAVTTPTDTGFVADTDADPISSGALTIPTNGGGIAICSDASTTTRTWTGFTEDLDVPTANFHFGTGTLTGAATPTITVSGANAEDGALSWIIFGPPFTPTQAAFRLYGPGTESGSTALAAQDTNADNNYNNGFQVRFRIQEASGVSGLTTDDYRLMASENGGSYVTVQTSNFTINSAASGLTDDGATTNRLTGGTGSFIAGVQDTGNTLIENYQLTASNFTEHVWGLTARPAFVTNNDTIDYRVQYNTSGSYVDFSSYVVTPRITIKRAILSQTSFRFYENGTESGSTAIDAQDTNIVRNTTTTPRLHIRFRIQETNGFSDFPSGCPFKLMISKNGAEYGTLDTSDWSIDTLSDLADDNATTNRLGAGTGSFYAGLQEEGSTTGQTQNVSTLQASNYTEMVWAIQATGAGAFVNNTTYDFKVILPTRQHPTLNTNLDSYTQIPRLTVTGGTNPSYIFYPNYYLQPLLVR